MAASKPNTANDAAAGAPDRSVGAPTPKRANQDGRTSAICAVRSAVTEIGVATGLALRPAGTNAEGYLPSRREGGGCCFRVSAATAPPAGAGGRNAPATPPPPAD